MSIHALTSGAHRLLAEEEEKVKSLLALQEEQEEQLLQTQREKQELRQEMEKKTHSLGEAQHQLEKVRASRRRVDQDIAVSSTLVCLCVSVFRPCSFELMKVSPPQDAQRKLRQASTSVKHWNVQMNRLMHPICPGGMCTIV